ncbi:hypothetical protein BJF82_16125 [Kytococcus sp. CUA-901]|nr:hypothetical protein BJF82_16125 [Kytococcus sp. CUA-901]
MSAGLEFVGVVDGSSALLQVLLIAGITVVATASVVSGVDKGIKWLSNINLSLAGLLLIFVLVAGPTLFLLNDMVQSIGYYLQNFFSMSFSTFAYQEEGPEWLGSWTTYYWGWWISFSTFAYQEEGPEWLGSWTTYYWGWWISWSPFVGIFYSPASPRAAPSGSSSPVCCSCPPCSRWRGSSSWVARPCTGRSSVTGRWSARTARCRPTRRCSRCWTACRADRSSRGWRSS